MKIRVEYDYDQHIITAGKSVFRFRTTEGLSLNDFMVTIIRDNLPADYVYKSVAHTKEVLFPRKPVLTRTPEELFDDLLQKVNNADLIAARKKFYKSFADEFEITGKALWIVYKAIYNDKFIRDMYPLVKGLCCYKGATDRALRVANNRHELSRQLAKDNQQHIAPLCLKLGVNPAQARVLFGKGLWKKICNSSPTRIALFAETIINYESPVQSAQRIQALSDAPSSIIKCLKMAAEPPFVKYIEKHLKGQYSNKALIRKLYITRVDIRRFERALNEKPAALNITPDNLIKYHDNLHKRYLVISNPNSTVEFAFVQKVSDILQGFKSKTDLNVILLKSAYELSIQGKDQGHCVSSYASYCRNNRSMIFSINENANIISTLELAFNKELKSFSVRQNYGKFNSTNIPDSAKLIAQELNQYFNSSQELKLYFAGE